MKKFLLILLSAILVLTMLCSCNTQSDGKVEDNTLSGQTKMTFADFKYNDIEIKINSDSKLVVEKLGEPLRTESFDAGCGDTALGYIYSYSGFEIRTNPIDGIDYIDKIVIQSDLVSTTEGASIGMESSEIIKNYGEPTAKSDELLRYESKTTILQFDINTSGVVTFITYKPAN